MKRRYENNDGSAVLDIKFSLRTKVDLIAACEKNGISWKTAVRNLIDGYIKEAGISHETN